MKRYVHLPLVLFALAGSALAVTACNPDGSTAAPRHSAPAASTAAVSHPAARHSSPEPSASAPSRALTRVIANCDLSSPGLTARPSGIVIACGDGNLGVERLAWSDWGTYTASGQGTLYENLCQPDCAAGKYGRYPVAVRLSGVKSSSEGAYFSELSVTWKAGRPPNSTPNSFELQGPAR